MPSEFQGDFGLCCVVADRIRLSAPLSREYRTRLVDAAATWDFKPHNLDVADLFRVACILFEGILDTEGIAELDIERGEFDLNVEQ